MENVSPGRLMSMVATLFTFPDKSGKSDLGTSLAPALLEPLPRLATKAATPAATAAARRMATGLVFMGGVPKGGIGDRGAGIGFRAPGAETCLPKAAGMPHAACL